MDDAVTAFRQYRERMNERILGEDNRIIKMLGLGLASAVFLDATLVRMLLVPATILLVSFFGRHLRQLSRRMYDDVGELSNHVQEVAGADAKRPIDVA